jgi:hypothetical protein
VIRFSVRVKSYGSHRVPAAVRNRFLRESLIVAAKYWIQHFLPLHFTATAYQRYQYSRRGSVYNAIKAKMEMVQPWQSRKKYGPKTIPAPKPPLPWVWSGDLRTQLLSMSPEQFNIQATATSNRQKIRVPIPSPHPIPAGHKGELGKLNHEEMEIMTKIAFDHYVELMESVKEFTELQIVA